MSDVIVIEEQPGGLWYATLSRDDSPHSGSGLQPTPYEALSWVAIGDDGLRADLSALTKERDVWEARFDLVADALDVAVALAERQREALDALAWVVRDEYGDKYTLAEIASTWGMATAVQVEALREYERAVLADEGPDETEGT